MEGNIENADDLRDVLASMEPFKYHCYGVENKVRVDCLRPYGRSMFKLGKTPIVFFVLAISNYLC